MFQRYSNKAKRKEENRKKITSRTAKTVLKSKKITENSIENIGAASNRKRICYFLLSTWDTINHSSLKLQEDIKLYCKGGQKKLLKAKKTELTRIMQLFLNLLQWIVLRTD